MEAKAILRGAPRTVLGTTRHRHSYYLFRKFGLPPAVADAPVSPGREPAKSLKLQVGAYTSQPDAVAAWNALQGKYEKLMVGYSYNVQRADLGKKGVWFRLQVGDFANHDLASELCDQLKKGGDDCFLPKYR